MKGKKREKEITGEILKKKKGNDLSKVSGVHIIVIREPLKSSESL